MQDVSKEEAKKVSHWSSLRDFAASEVSHVADHSERYQDVPTSAERSYTQNLERELKLMASAYHDLAGRLQMNNVVLQRRAEAPKSWLGRQRKAMEGVGGLVR